MHDFSHDHGPPLPETETGDDERDSLIWRRNFLSRLIPDLQDRRLRTRDGNQDSTEETLHRLRFRLAEIDARLGQLDSAE